MTIDPLLFDLLLPSKPPTFVVTKSQFVAGYAMSGSKETKEENVANMDAILDFMRGHDGAMTAKELSAFFLTSRESISHMLAKLEKKGVISRAGTSCRQILFRAKP